MTRTYNFDECGENTVFDFIFLDKTSMCEMPVTHKQDYYTASNLLKTGKIEPKKCDVFQEKLAYFFYGRPSYYVAQEVQSRNDKVYLPVCFILDANSITIDKVFPFDSGAFANGYYDGFIHKDMDIERFAIYPPTIESIKSFIEFFYGDNNSYYKSRNKPMVSSSYDELELQSYVNLLNNHGEEAFDERFSSIEIISKNPVVLAESVVAVIAPVDFKVRYAKELQRLGNGRADIITYDTFGGSPSSYNPVIRDKLYGYLCQKGYICVETQNSYCGV